MNDKNLRISKIIAKAGQIEEVQPLATGFCPDFVNQYTVGTIKDLSGGEDARQENDQRNNS
jgi:hypothetical protein